MSSIADRQKNIVDEFSALTSWEDRYKRIIAIGKDMPDLDKDIKQEENRIKACSSQVWIVAELDKESKVIYYADSDAMIVRGLIALLLSIYSGASPDDIIKNPPSFIEEIGLVSNLSPSRANGLHAMIKQIQMYAIAFKAKLGMQKTIG